MSRWIVALPLIAVGVSFGDYRAASAARVVEPVAGTVTSAQREPAQARPSKSANVVRHRHHFVHHSKPSDSKPARSPLPGELAKVPAFPPPLSSDEEAVLRPRSVYTISVPAPATPAETSQPQVSRLEGPRTDAASDLSLGRRVDTDDAAAYLSVLTDRSDDTRIDPMAGGVPPAPVPLTAIELLMLFGCCGCAAIGFYGLVTLGVQRRTRRLEQTPPLRRSHARAPSAGRDHNSDRIERQRLFPHQFGAAIRSG